MKGLFYFITMLTVSSLFSQTIDKEEIIGKYYIEFTCNQEGNKFKTKKGYNCMVVELLPSNYLIFFDEWNKKKPEVLEYKFIPRNEKSIVSILMENKWEDCYEIIRDKNDAIELIDIQQSTKNRTIKYIKTTN